MDEREASEASGNFTKMTVLLKNKNIYKSADHLMSMAPAPKHINTSSRLFCESKGQFPMALGVSSSSLSSMEKRLNGGGNTRSVDNLNGKMPIKTSSLEHNEFMVNVKEFPICIYKFIICLLCPCYSNPYKFKNCATG